MDKDRLDKFLDEFGKKLRPPNFLDRLWRRACNRCEQCGARLIAYENEYGKNLVCSRSSKHIRYAADLSLVAVLASLVFMLAFFLLVQNCGGASASNGPHRHGQDREIFIVPDRTH